MCRVTCLLAGLASLAAGIAPASADDIPTEDRKASRDPNMRYFLYGNPKDAKIPETGAGLVLVLPGGDGSSEFQPFVQKIAKEDVPPGTLVAQLVAVKWADKQEVVWPTKRLPAPKMKFTTEEFVGAVVKDVSKLAKIDPKKTFVVGWSSGGPAAYAVCFQPRKAVAGAFVAMSVYKPEVLPQVSYAKGQAMYLYHSAEDKVCPLAMAEKAEAELKAAGATATMKKYAGGHGWPGTASDDIKAGIDWLFKNAAK